jgi:hypothetical protein
MDNQISEVLGNAGHVVVYIFNNENKEWVSVMSAQSNRVRA